MDATTQQQDPQPATTQPNMRLIRCSRLEHLGDQGWLVSLIFDMRVADAATAVLIREAADFERGNRAWWIAHPEGLERIAEQIPAVRWKLDTRRAFEEAASG